MSRGLIVLALFPIGFWQAGEAALMWYGIVLFSVSFAMNLRRVRLNRPQLAQPNFDRYEPLQWR